MRCPSCSHEIPDEPFCQRCGKPLKFEKTDPIEPKWGTSSDAKAADKPDYAGNHPQWYGIVWATLAVALYIAIADASVAGTGASPVPTAGTRPRDDRGYQQMSKALDRLNAAADVLNGKMDHSLFEIDALAAKLGSDPNVIFQFVRDQIRYEPYVGVLRGALGALICRSGNSLDRSLLLAALLQKAGLSAQIANGTLSAADARALVLRTFEPSKPRPSALSKLSDLNPDLSNALGVDQQQLQHISADDRTAAIAARGRLMAYVDSEADVLTAVLAKAGVEPSGLTLPDQVLAEAQDHYWVRYQDASGAWIDLDSAFGNAAPGRARTESTRSFDPNAVPDELYNRLHVALTLRAAAGTGEDDPSDQVLLDQDLRIADLQGKTVTLTSAPVPRVDPFKRGVTLAQVLDSAKAYQTTLVVGDQVIAGKGFDLHGQVGGIATPEGVDVEQAGGIGRANGGLWGGIGGATGGGSEGAPKNTAGHIIGEWVDYTLTSPGIGGAAPRVRTYHRDIVAPVTVLSWSADSPDKPRTAPTHLGLDALRRQLMWSQRLLPVVGALRPDYAGYLRLQALIASRPALDAFNKALHGLPMDRATLTQPPQAMATSIVLAATAMNPVGSHDGAPVAQLRSYFDQPGLIAYEQASVDSSGKPDLREGFDVISYSPRVLAIPGTAAVDGRHQATALQVRRGVLVTRLEAALSVGASGSDSQVGLVANATNVFTAAQHQAIPIIVLRPGESGARQIARLAVSDAVKAELAEDLGAGQTLIIPSQPVTIRGGQQIGWWRWRSKPGELVGVMPGERGQAMTEKAIIEYMEALNSELCFLGAAKTWNSGEEGAGDEGAAKSIECALGMGWEPGIVALGGPEYVGTVLGILLEIGNIGEEYSQ
jgi:hypothetical protein